MIEIHTAAFLSLKRWHIQTEMECIVMSVTLGEKIRTLRIKNGYTQNAVALRLCVSKQAVSKWENDHSYPDIFLLPRLAKLLSITLDDLLSEAGFSEESGSSHTAVSECAEHYGLGGDSHDII
ncbi:helix-turn-helix domain-containing protein [Papillibacter cinnamivorans]|uniref:DNA-binding transcriptional regulator, XRE-family HTH domain n=1 Tax=Papillibacter cinnamivorans DSM 12816 TaxID=1122930 RepID=A0A1W2BW85_9FIRM|nr:helix-turn-helix transcriptional regulator [Papillibacter cinnamivorans]SMC76862.1 DNA-binding transcriptional regulator, XRE-family HTH domain [Papillibacter cinnamivorans DSM 12816]